MSKYAEALSTNNPDLALSMLNRGIPITEITGADRKFSKASNKKIKRMAKRLGVSETWFKRTAREIIKGKRKPPKNWDLGKLH
jgi:hypothetical protein